MKFCLTLINLLARHFVSEDNNQVKEITMIFDDLKNISFYKGIHPNLDKAIDYLYEHRKDTFELGKYDIDGDKVFFVENIFLYN